MYIGLVLKIYRSPRLCNIISGEDLCYFLTRCVLTKLLMEKAF